MELRQDDLPGILLVLGAVGTLLSVAGLWFVRRLVRQVEATFNIKVPSDVVTQLEGFARMGAAYAEEQMRKGILGLIKDAPASGAEKLELAVVHARSLAPGSLANFSDAQIKVAVEAQLPELRARVSAAPAPEAGSKSLPPIPRAPAVPSDVGTTFTELREVDTAPATPAAKRGTRS